MDLNNPYHTIALQLGLLCNTLANNIRDTNEFMDNGWWGWTRAEIEAYNALLKAIKALDEASERVLSSDVRKET